MSTQLKGSIRLAGVVRESIVDGPGIRFTVFTQGCPHHCPGCHNPQTHDPAGGYDCEMQKILDAVEKNPLLRGITLSGGEPFEQPEQLLELAKAVVAMGKDVVAFSGYTFEQLVSGTPEQKALLEEIDVLIDGPFLLAEKSLEISFRGSRNQRILDVRQSLAQGRAVNIQSGRWQGEY